ncbi:TniQ family protein [Paenibacillus sp. WC2504]|uniref:TniQ family protein n=1 Tax=Paenibacillus sp. WC2504 TaxID=3461403 RepID=UPI004045A970
MSLTWNREWILPSESLWSILEKLKYANQINTKQLLQSYGSTEAKKIKAGKLGKRFRNINSLDGLDVDLLEKATGINLENYKRDAIQSVYRVVPKIIQSKNIINENLVYCTECISQGFHSFLHQVVLFEKCPFHLSKLEKLCKNCSNNIPYLLPQHELESGFLCNCGESMVRKKSGYNFMESWTHELAIRDERILSGFSMSTKLLNKIESTILHGKLVLNDTNRFKIMDHLFASMENENKGGTRLTFKMNFNNSNSKEVEINLYDEIYNTSRDVLISFEKFLLRTILFEHSHCIRRFSGLYKSREDKEFPKICPYAYAYIFWKESLFGINPFYNEVIPRKKRALKELELPFYCNNDAIKETIAYILKNFGGLLNHRSLMWVIRHMVWNVAKNHFNEWIVIAREYAEKSIRPKTRYDEFNFAEIISFTIDENESVIELFLSSSDEIHQKKQMQCPYNNQMKEFRKDEFSHLPMRLAINPGFNNEKKAAEKYLYGLRIISLIK